MFDKMFESAYEAYGFAYCKYSNFRVGASVLLKNGQIVNGCNVENASYGLTNCAERTALFKAISMGYTKDDIVAILIVANSKKLTYPCGACRQVMVELMNMDCIVYICDINKNYIKTTVYDLLPNSFNEENL